MRACMFEYTTLIWRVCQKLYTSSPHRARSVHDGVIILATSTRLDGFMRTHAYVCDQSVSCMSSQSKNNNPLLIQINLSCCQEKSSDGPSGPQMESMDIADNHLSGCERTTTTALQVGQTYMLNSQNAQLWCATCLKKRKPCTHTEWGSYQAYYIWWSPSPLFAAYYMHLP